MEQKNSPEEGSFVVRKENTLMKTFYKLQLNLEEDDHERFWDILQLPLPVTIRVNPCMEHYSSLIAQLADPSFVQSLSEGVCHLEEVPWFPNRLVWKLNSSRNDLKKSEGTKKLHSWINNASESGLISRQEIVSMLPPLFLDIHPGHSVLDMCAAPGSKTQQIIEILQHSGLVVANDVDWKRAYMLIHQLHRASTPSMIVTNHQGQSFPRTGPKATQFLFDRILCDVPCSGDGAIRKTPLKWRHWKLKDGYAMHNLQLQIVRRAVSLCKSGGLICYSTCSLNPIENEAVVSALMNEMNNAIEIVDLPAIIMEKYPGLTFRHGMKTWKVLGNASKESASFVEYESHADVPPQFKTYRPTVFPVNVPDSIENTIRIMPHDVDSGGFYVCIFRKIRKERAETEEELAVEKEENKEQAVSSIEESKTGNASIEESKTGDASIEESKTENAGVEESKTGNPGIEESKTGNASIEESKTGNVGIEEESKTVNPGIEEESKKNTQKRGGKKKTTATHYEFKVLPEDSDVFSNIFDYYGLLPEVKELLYSSSTTETQKSIYLVSHDVKAFLERSQDSSLKLLNLGVKILVKYKGKANPLGCLYRLTQEGIPFISPFMTKRKVRTSDESILMKLITEQSVSVETIEDQALLSAIEGTGVFLFEFELKAIEQLVTMKLVPHKIICMAPKEHIASLKFRYNL